MRQNPNLEVSCDTIREGYRKFPQGSHIIFYKSSAKSAILVVRILHKSMDYDLQL
ncbi:MAG: type II toxin-antitoxin system RelE/ParE family toxin [Burkholderiales bacterium]|nr:type II toxin-antitoxin system RelE/ParE family toxin [Burkholderiales bacterium]